MNDLANLTDEQLVIGFYLAMRRFDEVPHLLVQREYAEAHRSELLRRLAELRKLLAFQNVSNR